MERNDLLDYYLWELKVSAQLVLACTIQRQSSLTPECKALSLNTAFLIELSINNGSPLITEALIYLDRNI